MKDKRPFITADGDVDVDKMRHAAPSRDDNENRFSVRGHVSQAPRRPTRTIGPTDAAAFWLETFGPKRGSLESCDIWENPTRCDGFVDLDTRMFQPGAGIPWEAGMVRVQCPAGARVAIPKIYARALHVVIGGYVVGGSCPAWRCEGSFPISPDIADPSHEPFDGGQAA